MQETKFFFITGGARSGKSRFAEKLALTLSDKVHYIATAEAKDNEMKNRISKHKKSRPKNWITHEIPFNVTETLKKEDKSDRVFLIDCLTLLVTNYLTQVNAKGEVILKRINNLADVIVKMEGKTIIVSNEVGMGLVPEHPLSRFYRDILGHANQLIADKADNVYFTVSGIPLRLKGKYEVN